jgi:hypothetical protein
VKRHWLTVLISAATFQQSSSRMGTQGMLSTSKELCRT